MVIRKSLLLFLIGLLFLSMGFVSATNCWLYDSSESNCDAQSDCQWMQDDWGGWCGEKGCWNYWMQSQCDNESDDLNCFWKSSDSSGWCGETSCYTWEGTSATQCENNSEGLNCDWEANCFGWNENVDCWTLSSEGSCENVSGCIWGMCEEEGCWKYDGTDLSTCQAHNGTNGNPCYWNSNGNYCYELNCWNYDGNQSVCLNSTLNGGLNCQWDSGYDYCNEIECWSFDYTNETQCVTNALANYNLSCTWDGQYCMSSGCFDYFTESGCDGAQGCSWETSMGGGWCEEVQCWSFDQWNGGTEEKCNGTVTAGTDAADFNLSCVWDNGACYADINTTCANFTTESECMDTYFCWWECSDWSNQSTCECKEPMWEETGSNDFFDEWNPGCYIFDIPNDYCNQYNNQDETNCTTNVDNIDMPYNCTWDAGNSICKAIPDCNKVVGCNFTITGSGSDTAGLCDPITEDNNSVINLSQTDVDNNGINCSMINDTQLCNNIPALSTCCEWKDGACQEKLDKSCWENMDKKIEDEFNGIKSCADASIFTNPEKKCNEMAGFPLFMPCEWNSTISECKFKSNKVFGNKSWSLSLVQNKKNCEAAGGKWVQEWYCEGNRSVPAGRCEQKADEENNCDVACFACEYKFDGTNYTNLSNVKTACYGSDLGYCEFIQDSTAPNGFGYCGAKDEFKDGIATDCTSDCGSCTYMGNPSAASNFDGSKKYSNCNTPKCYCEQSYEFGSVKCKWVPDSDSDIGGYCVDSTTKTCQDSCDRCYSKTDCNNDGRKALNAIGSCEWVTESGEASTSDTEGLCRKKGSGEVCWDGIDNDGDGLIDCSDSNCYSDSFCGFVEGDCPSITSQTTCEETQLANGMNCSWVSDMWGSFCDFPGSNCYSYDGNQSQCNLNNATCEWSSGDGDGWCEQDWDSAQTCWNLMSEDTCVSGGCNWTNDSWCDQNPTDSWCQDYGGWCDPPGFAPKNCWLGDNTNSTYCEAIDSSCYYDGNWCMEQGCWNYDSNSTACDSQDNCNWQNDDWASCEVDWSVDCWKYDSNESACNSSGTCLWFGGVNGWCGNKYDRCWNYNDNSSCSADSNCYWTDWNSCEALCYDDSLSESSCNSLSGCTWRDGWCEDSSMGGGSGGVNCWNYSDSGDCGSADGCKWKGAGWCDPKGFAGGSVSDVIGASGESGSECWKYDGNQSACTNSTLIEMSCSWILEPWPFCEPDWSSSDCWNGERTNQTYCEDLGCWWNNDSGMEWCMNPVEQCFMNTTLNNETCNANDNCNWTIFNSGCMSDQTAMMNCMMIDNSSACTNATNNDTCVWNEQDNMCQGKFESCFQSMTENECNQHSDVCFWNDFMGFCDPLCFSDDLRDNSSACSAVSGCRYAEGSCEPSAFSAQTSGECEAFGGNWIDGWCNPPGMGKMFKNMDMGAPVMIAQESGPECNENSDTAYADLCGIGLKDSGKSFTFGATTADFSEAGICNGENIITFGSDDFGMGSANQGSGTSTVKYYVYLDTDGSRVGGCAPSNNKSDKSYEFFLKFESSYNNSLSKATQSFTAKKCNSNGGTWAVADISLSTWKQKMCSMVGGPLIAVTKTDLEKFPTLYNSEEDMRIYAAIADSSRNASVPRDAIGPGWFTPGAVDFELKDFFSVGGDAATFEDILKKGYVEYEDCYTPGDEDNDGVSDCNDWDCQYANGCENSGVNAAGYVDSSMPKITGVKVEEYTDAALIMYSTNKPTTGTLTFYGNDSTCGSANATLYDRGMNTSSMRDYKLWHDGQLYNDSGVYSLNYALDNDTTYYYKLKVCDSGGKCSVSKCSSFRTAGDRCGYCNFVTLINSPTGWTVSYDLDTDGTYEHIQGSMCGPKAGMKTNYSYGRKANIKLSEDDSVVQMEFLNVTLTKTGLTSKTRKISTSGDLIHDTTENYVGMPSGTRDKIINNLHPEECRVTIPTTGGDCATLYHCDDNGDNCVDRTSESELISSNSTSCTWEIPYCEFSTWDADGNTGSTSTSSTSTSTSSGGSGGSSSGGGGGGSVLQITEEQFNNGYIKEISAGTSIRFPVGEDTHIFKLVNFLDEDTVSIEIYSEVIKDTIDLGETKNYDVDEDGVNDLSVKLNSVNQTGLKATLTLQKFQINDEDGQAEVTGDVVGYDNQEGTDEELSDRGLSIWFIIIAVVVFVGALIGLFFYFKNKGMLTSKK